MTPTPPVRELDLDDLILQADAHPDPDAGMCVMEAVAFVAGEPHSDHPQCASKVIGAFLRNWNDGLPDNERQQLKQYIPRLVGSAGTTEQENQRAWMAVDWLARVQAPAWLRLAGLDDQADILASLTELTPDTAPSVRPALEAARSSAYAAWAAAGDAARDAARVAARDAAWVAARDAARDAAGDAAGDAAWAAAGDAAGVAAGDAARDAAWVAARVAAGDAAAARLQPTRDELIPRAHDLVDRMLAVTGN